MRVLCAGDRFITPAALGDAARAEIDGSADGPSRSSSGAPAWPDEPFRRRSTASGRRPATRPTWPGGWPARDVLLSHLGPVTADVLRAATDLRVVGITRGGPVNVDLDAATERGVPVVYLPGRNLGAVAEFTVGVMITLPRSIARASAALTGGELGRQVLPLRAHRARSCARRRSGWSASAPSGGGSPSWPARSARGSWRTTRTPRTPGRRGAARAATSCSRSATSSACTRG